MSEEESRRSVSLAEWLQADIDQDYFPILDKIEEMPNIRDLPEDMVPAIEIRSDDITCRISYVIAPSGYGYFVFFVRTRQTNKVVRSFCRGKMLKDLKNEASYPMNVLSKARSMMEAFADAWDLGNQMFPSNCFYLSLTQVFYDREGLGYLQHIPCEEN